MRYLTLAEVLSLHRRVIEESGGATGARDLRSAESAVLQPQMAFEGKDLYPSGRHFFTAALWESCNSRCFTADAS